MPVFEYIANYDYISTVLCINKDVPAMACNGKCHLMKELAKASDLEKPTSQDKKHTSAEITDFYIQTDVNYLLPVFYLVAKPKLNYSYLNTRCNFTTSSIFRPPIFIT